MEFSEVVYKRRSIRAFTDKPVSDETVQKLLDYGHYAPSAGNLKPWRYIILRDEAIIDEVVETTYTGKDPDGPPQKWMKKAPVIIAVCAERSTIAERYGDHNAIRVSYMDSSACIQNILLGAQDLGLGSTWVSGYDEEQMAKVLKAPAGIVPIALLPIGYPASAGNVRPMAELSEITYYESWGRK